MGREGARGTLTVWMHPGSHDSLKFATTSRILATMRCGTGSLDLAANPNSPRWPCSNTTRLTMFLTALLSTAYRTASPAHLPFPLPAFRLVLKKTHDYLQGSIRTVSISLNH